MFGERAPIIGRASAHEAQYAAGDVRLALRSRDPANRTTIDVRGAVVDGLGLLASFPQLGNAYGRRGLPFGCDAVAYRYQALQVSKGTSEELGCTRTRLPQPRAAGG